MSKAGEEFDSKVEAVKQLFLQMCEEFDIKGVAILMSDLGDDDTHDMRVFGDEHILSKMSVADAVGVPEGKRLEFTDIADKETVH